MGKYMVNIYGFFHVFPGDDDGDIFNVDIFRGEYMPKKNGTFDTCVENSWKMIDYMWKIDGEKMENRWDIYYKYY
jgi:hypothetical protein